MSGRKRIHKRPRPPRQMSGRVQALLGLVMLMLLVFFLYLGMHA